MPTAYVRNVARMREPAVLDTGHLMANAPAEALFARNSGARAACIEAISIVRRTRRAHACNIGNALMLFLPLFSDDDRIEAVAGVRGGLEDASRALHDLQKALPQLSEILHEAPSIVLTARPNGEIDYLSRRFYESTMADRKVSPHQALLCTIANGESTTFSIAWTNNIARGSEFTLMISMTTRTGVRRFDLRARPVERSRGAGIVKWAGTLIDVEEAVMASEDLARLAHRLSVLSDAGNVISGVRTLEELAGGLIRLSRPLERTQWIIELRNTRTGEILHKNMTDEQREAILTMVQRADTVVSFEIATSNPRQAAVAAPIRSSDGKEFLGFIGFIGSEGAELAADRTLVAELARRAATGIERIVSVQRDHELGLVLQRAMLPLALPYSPGVRLDVAYEPAQREALVGGDWYDAFELEDGMIAIAIGDVAGHGIEAAIVMNQIRQAMRVAAIDDPDPANVLSRVNRILVAQNQPMATALFGLLDPLTLVLTLASAGHLLPVFVKENGETQLVQGEGTPLGVLEDLKSVNTTVELEAGGALVMYTDGVVEDERDLEKGERALFDALQQWATTGFAARIAELQSALRVGSHQDDAAMFALRFPHVDDFEIRLSATPFNGQRMRLATRRFVAGCPFEEDRAFDSVLAIGEAVNNVVEHAYAQGNGFVALSLKRESHRLIADVRDEGSWREQAPQDDRMHGLELIERLADVFEIRRTRTGTIAHIEVEYAPRRAQVLVLQRS